MLKANIRILSLIILCYLLVRRFPKTRIREQNKNIFWFIKNEEKTVGDHLKLYF